MAFAVIFNYIKGHNGVVAFDDYSYNAAFEMGYFDDEARAQDLTRYRDLGKLKDSLTTLLCQTHGLDKDDFKIVNYSVIYGRVVHSYVSI